MPPMSESARTLFATAIGEAEQTALLKNWIDHGASFPKEEPVPLTPAEHWAFQPVRQPPIPAVKHPGHASRW